MKQENAMKPANPNLTPKALELLEYLHATAGKKIITGQHTQTVPMEERAYIHNITGRYPKLLGFELLSYSPNINYENATEECLKEVRENHGTVEEAIRWHKETGGIVALCFHWFSPVGGFDKSFFSCNTDFDARRVFIQDTPERWAFYHDMSVIAKVLERFLECDIPVLWRPFHEAEGDWFWWSAKGHEVSRDLYRLMFDYYVNVKHLDNLLWVWNSPAKDGYPGDEYVDVVSRDLYASPRTLTDYKDEYEELIANTSADKVAAIAETGVIPDIELLSKTRVPWAYYMTWSREFGLTDRHNSDEMLKKMYSSDYAIVL